MIFEVLAVDKASGSFKAMSKEAGGAAASFDKLGKAAFGITVVFAAFAVNAAAKFESAMTRINTQAGVPIGQLKALSNAILQLSPKVGFNPDELATSLYHVESAFHSTGISAAKAIDIVKTASELSKIGNANLEDTTQAIIGTLASGIKGISGPLDAAAQLNQLVGAGDTTLQKVAKSIATGILPVAKTLGLSFNDVAAAIATTTDNVTPADEAATRLKTTLLTLIKPSKQQVAAFQEIGLGALSLGQDFRKPDGLLVAVQDLKTHLDEFFPAGQKSALSVAQLNGAQKAYYQTLVNGGTNTKDATKQSQAFRDSLVGVSAETLRANVAARALGGSKTAGAFLTLLQEIDRLKSKYHDFGTAAQAAAKFQEAWAVQQGTFKQKLDDLKASWDVFLIKAGNAILPTLKAITDLLSKHPGLLQAAAIAVGVFGAAWAVLKVESLISGLGTLAARILLVGTASRTAAGGVAALDAAGAVGARGVGGRAAAGAAGAAGAEGAGLLGLSTAGTLGAAGVVLAGIGIGLDQSIGSRGGKEPFRAQTFKFLNLESFFPKNLRAQIDDVSSKYGAQAGTDFALALARTNGNVNASWKALLGGGHVAAAVKGLQIVNGVVDDATTALKRGEKASDGWWQSIGQRADIKRFQDGLKNSTILLQSSSRSLVDHAHETNADRLSIEANREGVVGLVTQAVQAAKSYAQLTGDSTNYTKSLNLALPAIEAAAAATGLNKGQIEALFRILGVLPPNKAVPVSTPGADTATAQVKTFLQALALIPPEVRVPVTAFITNPSVANQLGGSAFGVDITGFGKPRANGGISLKGRPGGIVQWAEAGGESFIPLSASKRARSLDIWTQTGKLLGVPGMANGALRRPLSGRGFTTDHVGSSDGSMQTLINEVRGLRAELATLDRNWLNVEHWHGDQTDANGLVSQVAAHNRASFLARRV